MLTSVNVRKTTNTLNYKSARLWTKPARKMYDDVQQPEQAPQADAGVKMSDLTANNNIMANVISLDMMASVEADLLG